MQNGKNVEMEKHANYRRTIGLMEEIVLKNLKNQKIEQSSAFFKLFVSLQKRSILVFSFAPSFWMLTLSCKLILHWAWTPNLSISFSFVPLRRHGWGRPPPTASVVDGENLRGLTAEDKCEKLILQT